MLSHSALSPPPSPQISSSMRTPSVSSSSSKKIILLDSPIKTGDGGIQTAKRSASLAYALDIKAALKKIPHKYMRLSSSVQNEINKLWVHLQPSVGTSTQLWSVAKEVRS